jgi:hypothetical protein
MQEKISLPSKEIVVKDVLTLICEKTGNKLLVQDNQLIIVKKKKLVVKPLLAKQTTIGVHRQDTIIRETTGVRVPARFRLVDLPKKGFLLNKQPPEYLQSLDLKKEDNHHADIEEKIQPTTKKKTKSRTWFMNGYQLGAGGGVGFVDLINITDSGQVIKSTPDVNWNLRANFEFWLSSGWSVKTGIGFNRSKYSMKADNGMVGLGDTTLLDTASVPGIKLKVSSLDVPIILNYNFKIIDADMTLGIGGCVQYAVKGERIYSSKFKTITDEVSWSASPQPYSTDESMLYLNRVKYSLLGEIGYRRGKFDIFMNARIGINSFSKYQKGREFQFSINIAYTILSKK